MGDLVDLKAFRALKEKEEKEKQEEEERKLEEERQRAGHQEVNYLKSVLDIMLRSLPPVTGAIYVPLDDNYLFDASNTGTYHSSEDDPFISDEDFFSYEWGWASESEDGDEDV